MITAKEFKRLRVGDVVYIDPDFTNIKIDNSPGINDLMIGFASMFKPLTVDSLDIFFERIRAKEGWLWAREWLLMENPADYAGPPPDLCDLF